MAISGKQFKTEEGIKEAVRSLVYDQSEELFFSSKKSDITEAVGDLQ